MWPEVLPSSTHTPLKQPTSTHRLAINLELEGPAIPTRKASCDVYVPTLRSYGSNYGSHVAFPSVEHLDIVTTWKGLPIAGAAELCFWERTFKECLTRQIEDILIARFYRSENDLAELSESGVAHLLYVFLRRLRICEFPINIEDLCADMIVMHAKQGGRASWLGGEDIHLGLLNFLHSRECFVGVIPRCSVWVDFTRDFFRSYHGQYLHGYLIWQPPTIDFRGLQKIVVEGSGYCLSPSVHKPVVLGRYYAYAREAVYYFSSSDVSMQWNPAIQSFCGVVPAFRQYQQTDDHYGRGSYKSFLAVECVMTHSFPANVRLERVIRTRVALTVVPAPILPLSSHTRVRPRDSARALDGRYADTKRRNVFRDISNGQWRDPETQGDRRDSAMDPPTSVWNAAASTPVRKANNRSKTWSEKNSSWSPSYDGTPRSKTASAFPRPRSDSTHSASLRSGSVRSDISWYWDFVSKGCQQETSQPPPSSASSTDTEESLEMPYVRNIVRTPRGNPHWTAYLCKSMSDNPATDHRSAAGMLPKKTRVERNSPVSEHSSPSPFTVHTKVSPCAPRAPSNSPANSKASLLSSDENAVKLGHEDGAVLQDLLISRKRARADSGTFEGCSFAPPSAHGCSDEHVVNKRARIPMSFTRSEDEINVAKDDPTKVLKQMKEIREFYAWSLDNKRVKMEKMRDRSSEDSELKAFEEIFVGADCDASVEGDLVQT